MSNEKVPTGNTYADTPGVGQPFDKTAAGKPVDGRPDAGKPTGKNPDGTLIGKPVDGAPADGNTGKG